LALTLNGFGFSLGGFVLLPLAAVLGGGVGFRPSLASAGLLAALAVGPTAAAYTRCTSADCGGHRPAPRPC
jgi:hypothetical protein